jgi:hypothetical protein
LHSKTQDKTTLSKMLQRVLFIGEDTYKSEDVIISYR